jgi:hypothetical protein
MPRDGIGTRKKRKIFDLTSQGYGSRKISKLAYVSRPTAIKYMRLYRQELAEAESTIVQKITQEPEQNKKESIFSMMKRKIFSRILSRDDETPAGGEVLLHGLSQ